MSKDTITVSMNIYDIPIVVELLKKLEQENKQLKEEIEELKKANLITIDYQDLEQRINEAIEYIKNNIDNTGWLEIGSENVKELLEILGDKENER